jgi:heme-degrading monooxygenase HmoA
MFAVIFEVKPKPDRWDDYLAIAGSLRPELENIDGFMANERYTSRRREGRVLSLSIWRDEKAVIRWRTLARHHRAQARGRSEIFEDYHLRVGEIVADSRLPTGQSLLQQRFDLTEIGAAKLVTITEFVSDDPASTDPAAQLGLPQAPTAEISDHDGFAGINEPKRLLLVVSWADAVAGRVWRPPERPADLRHRAVCIIRDYGMHDRREAPQYHPPAADPSIAEVPLPEVY